MSVSFLDLSICYFQATVGNVENHMGMAADKGNYCSPSSAEPFNLECIYSFCSWCFWKLQPINCIDTEFPALP